MSNSRVNPVDHLSRRQNDGKFVCDQLMVRQRFARAQSLYWKNLHSHFGCVNAIEFSADGRWMLSGGDDKRVLLWNLDKAIADYGSPAVMDTEHTSNIFCLGFDSSRQRLFSGGNDEHLIVHKADTGALDQFIMHNDAIYGLSIDPENENLLATACNDGAAFILDLRKRIRSCQDSVMEIRSHAAFHAIMHNPVQSRLLTTANSRDGVSLWDVRRLRSPLIKFTDSANDTQSAMSVRFNITGTQIVALRRRHSVILYNLASHFPIAEFDDSTYYNSCTMKSCCFAGDEDQYILSGSDDFKLYMWKIPQELSDNQLRERGDQIFVDEAHMRLPSHRSIVNQVRYNYANSLIASSGVEKVIKLWSCFPLPTGKGALEDKPTNAEQSGQNRRVYSHEDYISLVLHSGQFMSHDYSHQSMKEDPRMMAFFDSLVQRDIEGWTSDSETESLDGYTLLRSQFDFSSDMSDSDTIDDILSPQTESYIASLVCKIESHAANKKDGVAENGMQGSSTASIIGSSSSSTSTRESPKGASSSVCKSEARPSHSSSSSPCPRWSRLSGSSISKQSCNKNDSTTSRASSDTRSNTRSTIAPPKDENAESDKIVQLIASKKIEQLRKTARVVARSARGRLKKVQRRYKFHEESGQSSNQDDKSLRYQQIHQLTESLSTLVEQNATKTPEQMRKLRSKSRKKLRRLATQSDFILTEAYPTAGDSSSSDSDSDIASPHELIANALAQADERFADDSDSSSSQNWLSTTDDDEVTLPSDVESDSSDETNLITFGDPNESSSSPTGSNEKRTSTALNGEDNVERPSKKFKTENSQSDSEIPIAVHRENGTSATTSSHLSPVANETVTSDPPSISCALSLEPLASSSSTSRAEIEDTSIE